MLRKDVLIAPVLEPEAASPSGGSRDIYVPAGSSWYCYMDNRMPLGASVEGGTTLGGFGAQLYVDGNHEYFVLPTYIRAGAIVPTIEIEQHVGERARQGQPNPITLNVYPGANGEYTMYLDDGVSRSSAPKGDPNKGHDDAAKSEYREVHITHTISDGVRTVRLERVHDGYNPLEDYYCVAFLQDPNDSAPVGLSIGGSRVEPITGGSPETRANQLAASSSNAWYYNENIHIAFVKLFDNANPLVVELK